MKTTLVLMGVLLLGAGCDRNKDADRESAANTDELSASEDQENTAERSGSIDVDRRIEAAKPAADNTEMNERDRGANTLTPADQGGSETDRTITQQVRQAVVMTDDLSMYAKNVKIITRDGVVTLRGPVKSEAEKAEVGRIARSTTGVLNVDNQLEVVDKPSGHADGKDTYKQGQDDDALGKTEQEPERNEK